MLMLVFRKADRQAVWRLFGCRFLLGIFHRRILHIIPASPYTTLVQGLKEEHLGLRLGRCATTVGEALYLQAPFRRKRSQQRRLLHTCEVPPIQKRLNNGGREEGQP